jgi:hypothetical protein
MENSLGSPDPEDLPNYKQTILYDYRLKTKVNHLENGSILSDFYFIKYIGLGDALVKYSANAFY